MAGSLRPAVITIVFCFVISDAALSNKARNVLILLGKALKPKTVLLNFFICTAI